MYFQNFIAERRKPLTSNERNALMKSFQANPYPELEEKHQLAKSLNISETWISQWFSMERSKKRKGRLLCEGQDRAFSNTCNY